jgi:4-amino-4-deoxy-L-arabinose transferase-like glycosyltransferase
MTLPWQQRCTVPAIFLAAVFLQLVFLALLPKSFSSNNSRDYAEYYSPAAQNLLVGKGLVVDSGRFLTLYPAGFPLFLAATYRTADLLGTDRLLVITAVNVLCMGAGCVLVFCIARRIFGERVGLFSAVLWITYICNLWLAKQPNSEIPFIPLFYGAVLCFVLSVSGQDANWAAASGLLLGCAGLVRPIVLLVPVVFGAFFLLRRAVALKRRVLLATVLVGAFVLAVLPWEWEVYRHTGKIVTLSTNGASSILDGVTFTRRPGDYAVPSAAADLMRRMSGHLRDLQTTGRIFHYLATELRQDPVAVLELYSLKVVRTWYGTESGAHEKLIAVLQFLYLLLCGVGMVLAWRRFPEQRYFLALFLTMVLYFWGMAVIALSILRYMVPVMAFLLIPLAAAADTILKKSRITPLSR